MVIFPLPRLITRGKLVTVISLEFVKLNRFFLQCGILWAFMDFYPLAHGPKGVTVTGALCAKIQLEEIGL